MEPLILAQDLTKCFDSFTAVAGVDFAVYPGEVVGFLGPNGAGKTTTIRMITCTSPLTAGSLTVFGLDVTRHPREIKAQIGVAPQENNFDPDFTVLHNLIAYGRYFRLPPREVRQRAAELLEFVQLTERAKEATEKLSGGMKRRLILARSLLNRPRLLILDEPTTGLDPQGRRLIWERIKALQQEGVTVVVTTHYMEEAEQLCDRILIMNQGRIIAEGSPRELIQHHVGGEVLEVVPAEGEEEALRAALDGCESYQRLGDRFEIFTRECGQVLERIRSRVRLASYGIRRPNLEDVFLRLTGRDLHE
jgi:lipooligosaccharide transport system ATP-binding protein